jgi:hypothetical protein
MAVLELESLVTEVNQYLKANQKVHKDDPILANVILNQVILEQYVEALQTKLRETQLEIEIHNQQALQNTQEQATHILANAGNQLEQQLQKVGDAWEERFKTISDYELAKIQRAALYAQIGGFLVLGVGALALGMFLGRFIFH